MAAEKGNAQLIYQPYSFQFYQKLNKGVYGSATNMHTAIKPYFIADSSTIRPLYDSLTTTLGNGKSRNWVQRILFDEHLVNVKNKDYTFYLDFLPDFQLGREFNDKQTTWLNTRGYQVGITIGSKFFIYTSGYENQTKLPNYERDYTQRTGMIAGQADSKINFSSSKTDWSYVTALIGYSPTKALTISLGHDKTFIGDGYRSVLLSDFAAANPMLRVTADLGKKVRYMAMWSYMQDRNAPEFNSFYNNRRKWGAFHYVDWTVNNKASLGFFNALIAEEANDQGQGHGFDLNYINPILFASGLRPSGTTPDHTLIGFNGKYKVLEKTTVYGQLIFDQVKSAGSNKSKNAWQLGFRGSDLFKVNRLNYLVEYNTATPNTYSTNYPLTSYTQLGESLAHPLGSDYREWLSIVNYSLNKFDFQGQINYARYGVNNVGVRSAATMKFAEGKVAYLLNPKYNLRLEVSGLIRQEKGGLADNKTTMITFGLRSSFRNLYHDF
ncbi:gliding motility protein RemB [Pedobacter sp. PAMC26386]|nr:gliding motility protein RemB [Pedobacter sp. PAMC26386]